MKVGSLICSHFAIVCLVVLFCEFRIKSWNTNPLFGFNWRKFYVLELPSVMWKCHSTISCKISFSLSTSSFHYWKKDGKTFVLFTSKVQWEKFIESTNTNTHSHQKKRICAFVFVCFLFSSLWKRKRRENS